MGLLNDSLKRTIERVFYMNRLELKRPLVIAHRGASAYAPENTLYAFQLAIEMQADAIELDVHPSKDGKLIVIHDDTIGRLSEGSGLVKDYTLEELRKYHFNNGIEKYADARIATLDEVYDLFAGNDMLINVEIKNPDDAFLQEVAACTARHKIQERSIYSSFYHRALTRMQELESNAFVAPLYDGNLVKPWQYAASFGARALHTSCSDLYLFPDYTKRAHELGIRVHPWTVNGREGTLDMLKRGVDGVITDFPDVARSCILELEN